MVRNSGDHQSNMLIVEDTRPLARAVQWCMEDVGFIVCGNVATVEKALRVLAEADIDVAVLDVNLGGESVYPVARRLRDMGVPFVFCTSVDRAEIAPEFDSAPIVDKPFTFEVLLRAVDAVMEDEAGVRAEGTPG